MRNKTTLSFSLSDEAITALDLALSLNLGKNKSDIVNKLLLLSQLETVQVALRDLDLPIALVEFS